MADNAANKGNNTKTIKIIRWTLGIMLMVLMAVGIFNGKVIIQKFKNNTPKEVKYEEFLKMADKKNVKKIVWSEKKMHSHSMTRMKSHIQQKTRNTKTSKKICLKRALK